MAPAPEAVANAIMVSFGIITLAFGQKYGK
jgi:hypothetical protein